MKNAHIASLTQCWNDVAAHLLYNSDIYSLLHAVSAGRFSFARESWYSQKGETAHELLLRAWDIDGELIPPGPAIAALAQEGALRELNDTLVFAALEKTTATGYENFSLNVLPSAVTCADFWQALEINLDGHKPENIIFEILEYEDFWTVDDFLMREALQKGYRFALDDFDGQESNWMRLADYAPYLSFVKLDGPLVRAGLNGDPALTQAVALIQNRYPGMQIIAEFVQNKQEAQTLYNLGILAVQGREMQQAANADTLYRPQP